MLKRFAVRAAVVYAFLYWLPTPLDSVPGLSEHVWNATEAAWRPAVEFAGKTLSLEVPEKHPSGSGDTLANFLQVGVTAVLALLLGAVWSLDKKRTRDEAVIDFTRDYLRLALAATMLAYGLAKVFVQQFQPFDEWTTFQTFGDASPMGLLWRFMGFSPTYERFTGALEVFAGVLLMTRRTATIGALVMSAVMTNVVMLNFCFDVPVKLGSSHLLLFALVLALPDLPRLFAVFFTRRSVGPRDLTPRYAPGWGRFVFPVVIFLVLTGQVLQSNTAEHWEPPSDAPLIGGYAVIGQKGDDVSWHFLQIAEGMVAFKRGAEAWKRAPMTIDVAAKTIVVRENTLHFEQGDGGLALTGAWDGKDVELTLQRVEAKEQPLLTRGFNWVQEYPFNR
ncbi:MAG: hypothetical protein JNM17_27495 [Archangium sp.]|nr:hypothetical protein [Archangium sp.]